MLRGIAYYKLENLSTRMAPMLRGWGRSLFRQGLALQGESGHADRYVPSLRCIPISASAFPKLLDADWVAPNATVIGDVNLAEGASLWHGVVVRGDTASVSIGKNSIVQDLAHIGSNAARAGDAVVIGDNVHIGTNANIDVCTLDNFAFVGMGATVHRGAKVESFGVLSAGAVLAENDVVPAGQIFVGSPAHYLRDLTQEEKHLMAEHKLEMQQLS